MKFLLVAATEGELSALREQIGRESMESSVDFLVTGIGMVATTHALTRHLLHRSYDVILNIGIAGALDHSLALGTVVVVNSDSIYGLGIEDGERILSLQEAGLPGDESVVPVRLFENSFTSTLPKVKGLTVNTASGHESSISLIESRSTASVETMEGAAFYFVCNQEGVSGVQLRAISNRVERRNRSAWDLELAVRNLQEAVMLFIKSC